MAGTRAGWTILRNMTATSMATKDTVRSPGAPAPLLSPKDLRQVPLRSSPLPYFLLSSPLLFCVSRVLTVSSNAACRARPADVQRLDLAHEALRRGVHQLPRPGRPGLAGDERCRRCERASLDLATRHLGSLHRLSLTFR